MLNTCISCKFAKACADYSANYGAGNTCGGYETITPLSPSEIIGIIQQTRAAAEQAKQNAVNIDEIIRDNIRGYKLSEKKPAELSAKLDALRAERSGYDAEMKRHDAIIEVWRHNLKISYIHNVLKAAPGILEKYNNKPYGEKTRAKIADDFKAETGARVYITNDSYISWSPGAITIYPQTYEINRIEIYTPYAERERVPLLSDKNRIIADNVETIDDSNNKYIVDPSGYIEHLAELDDIVTEHAAKANTAIDNFNSFNVLENGNYCHIYLKN